MTTVRTRTTRPARPGDSQASRPVTELIRQFATDRNSVFERQVCTAVVFFLSELLLLGPGVEVTLIVPWVIANLIMIAATGAAAVMRAPRIPPRVAMIIPMAAILAVGFLRAGTGGAFSIYTIMLTLPVLSLGVEPGRLPLLLGGPVTIVALALPVLFGAAVTEGGTWARIILVPIVLGLVCLSSNELTRRLRSRVRAVRVLQAEQESLLVEARENAVSARAASNLAREWAGQLTSVVNAVTEQSIIATDETGLVEVFNAGAAKMLKVAEHDALGRSVLRFHRPDEVAGSPGVEPFHTLTAGVREGTPGRGDWTYVAGDGGEIRVELSVTARRDAAGDVDGFLFVATDVTAAREQAKMKDEFVNLISHELRTPLSSILGYLELVADDEENPLSAEQLNYLAIIERNANRLLRLVSDLLFTAQVESGRFHVQEQPVDLNGVLQAALDNARPAASAKGVTIVLAATAEPLVVPGDAVRLAQAVDNLISNALKFTPAGGRVALTLRADAAEDGAAGDRALICVSDTGVGIPADELDRLFARFFRASTATKHAIPGVGLGLTITRAIAHAHGGDIHVASTLGEGTTFTMVLPRASASPRHPPEQEPVPHHQPQQREHRGVGQRVQPEPAVGQDADIGQEHHEVDVHDEDVQAGTAQRDEEAADRS